MKRLLSILFILFSFATFGQDNYTFTLLHGDSINIAKTIFNESGNTVIAVGDAQISTDNSKFGNGSILFDGTGDYVTMSSTGFQLREHDFSFDFWFKANTIETSEPFFTKYDDTYPSSKSYRFFMTDVSGNDAKLSFYAVNRVGSTPTVVASYTSTNRVTLADGSFHHIELTRNGTNLYVFLDGVSLPLTTTTAISTNTLDDLDGDFVIGYRSDISYYLDGNIDEFRVSIGTARHTSNFTPETSAYGETYDPEFALTDSLKAYWKFDESSGDAVDTIAGNDLTNQNTVEYTETGIINNAAEFTFADSNNYILEYADQVELNMNDSISFSFWIKLKSQPQEYYPFYSIINKWTNLGDNKSWALAYSNGDGDRFRMSTTNAQFASANNFYSDDLTLENDSLYHVVISVDAINNATRFYVNDTLRSTVIGSENVDSIYVSTSDILVATSVDQGRSDLSLDEMSIYHRLLYQSDVDLLWNSGEGNQYPFIVSASNIKTYNTNQLANIKTINGNPISNVKTLNKNTNK